MSRDRCERCPELRHLGVSLCAAELRLRASGNRPVQIGRAASADDSLTIITPEPQFDRLRLIRG
jgi:hypothetical protein